MTPYTGLATAAQKDGTARVDDTTRAVAKHGDHALNRGPVEGRKRNAFPDAA